MVGQIKKVIIVAGEQSGDILGAGLIRALRATCPDCAFEGIGGERMQAEGLVSHVPMERLSVMGFVEPLKRLPELLGILKRLKQRFRDDPPDLFIGIDSPDFNIRLELAAKKLGIFSAHYVSPSVWAWRQGRVKKIKKAVDLMLTLLPFEAEFYRKHDVPVAFIGHPLADDLPLYPDRAEAREQLGLSKDSVICALMPGSRSSEVAHLLPIMVAAADMLSERYEAMQFAIPAASEDRMQQIEALLADTLTPIRVINGESHRVMIASNCVVMASGTTTLEAMLLKRPMVITYKWPRMTWEILKRLVRVPWVGLPNLLCDAEIAPELLQDEATPENIAQHIASFIEQGGIADEVAERFLDIHQQLKKNASESAATALIKAWGARQNAA